MSRKQTALAALLIFLVSLLLRLPNLGSFLTPDETRIWTTLTAQFLEALLRGDWAGTATSGYPGVTTTWAGSLGLSLQYLLDRPPEVTGLADMAEALLVEPARLDFLPWVRWGVALVSASGIAIIWLLARRLLGNATALLAAAMLLFDPFVLAHTRILNTDPLLAVFLAISWMSLILATQERRTAWFLLSGASFGLAALTKSPALILGPLAVAWIFWQQGHRQRTLKAAVKAGAVDLLWFGLAALVAMLLLWPALWTQPLAALQRVWNFTEVLGQTGHELGNFWLGRPVAGPGMLFYPAVVLWRSTPLTLIGLLLALIAMVAGRQAATPYLDRRPQIAALLLYCLWFGLALTFSPKKFDRYLLPLFPVLDVLAAWGWVVALAWLSGRRQAAAKRPAGHRFPSLGRMSLLLVAALAAGQAGYALWHLPTYLTAYSPLAGGIRTAERVLLIGWGEGLEEAAAYLNQLSDVTANRETADAADVPTGPRAAAWYGHNVFGPFFGGETYDLYYDLPTAADLYANDVDHVVTYVNQIQRGMLDESVRARLDQPLMTSRWGGVALAEVYDWPKPFQHTADRDMAPGLRLLGWDVKAYQPDGRALPVTLYWDAAEAAAVPPLPPVLVWMKDAAGEVWAASQETVPDGHHVEGWLDRPARAQRFHLEVPVGLLPGAYRLEAAAEAGESLALGSTPIPATRLDEIGSASLTGMQAPGEEALFADTYRLFAFAIEEADNQLVLDLLWDAQAPPTPRVKFFVHVIDRFDEIVAQHDATLAAPPGGTPIAWTASQLIRQRIRLNEPAPAASGPLVVYVGLYDADTGKRLPLAVQGQSIPDGRLLLTEISED